MASKIEDQMKLSIIFYILLLIVISLLLTTLNIRRGSIKISKLKIQGYPIGALIFVIVVIVLIVILR